MIIFIPTPGVEMASVYNGALGGSPSPSPTPSPTPTPSPPGGYYSSPAHLWRFNEANGGTYASGTAAIKDSVSTLDITVYGSVYQGSGRSSTTGGYFPGGSTSYGTIPSGG